MDLKQRWEASMAPNYGTPTLQLDHGKGVEVWDSTGKRYLDFLAGIAVSATGHAHPKVVAAIADQAGRLLHTSNLYAHEPGVKLAERLRSITGYDKVFFCNSGGEANEAALKLVRRHAHASGKPGAVVLALDHAFHGRTTATVTLTGQQKYQKGFHPLVAQIEHTPANDVRSLERAFARQPVSGLFLEPIQGESGVRPLSPAFLEAAARLCKEHDALLVADEIQTGVGRTGKFLCFDHNGLKADITTLAKGIASGMPLGVTLLTPRVASLLEPGAHGTTFGGNPVACAAALATLDVMEQEHLVENAAKTGAYLQQALRERVPGVKEVRGMGLLVGCEFNAPVAKKVKSDAEAAGLLVNAIGETVLRLAPPLIVTPAQVDEAIGILAKVVAE
jgi:predicted acetylornithine/succinylornithine family transaminase